MKQYKLTGWPELSPRFQKTTMRRIVSELSQRFASTRDLARNSGATPREVEELIARLNRDGMLMTRDAPQSVKTPMRWRDWWPLAALRDLVRPRKQPRK
jgi:hypothetical protein